MPAPPGVWRHHQHQKWAVLLQRRVSQTFIVVSLESEIANDVISELRRVAMCLCATLSWLVCLTCLGLSLSYYWKKTSLSSSIPITLIRNTWPSISSVDAAYENTDKDVAYLFKGTPELPQMHSVWGKHGFVHTYPCYFNLRWHFCYCSFSYMLSISEEITKSTFLKGTTAIPSLGL